MKSLNCRSERKKKMFKNFYKITFLSGFKNLALYYQKSILFYEFALNAHIFRTFSREHLLKNNGIKHVQRIFYKKGFPLNQQHTKNFCKSTKNNRRKGHWFQLRSATNNIPSQPKKNHLKCSLQEGKKVYIA